MTYEQYKAKLDVLKEILRDALERGDYNLEFDTREDIVSLNQRYYEE